MKELTSRQARKLARHRSHVTVIGDHNKSFVAFPDVTPNAKRDGTRWVK